MTLTAEDLDNVTDKAIECFRNGNRKRAQELFSALILDACFAEADTVVENIDRVMRLIEARVTPGTPLDEIRPHVESIMTQTSEPTDRYIGFTLLFRRLG